MSLASSMAAFGSAFLNKFVSPFNAIHQGLSYQNGTFTGLEFVRKVGFVSTDEELGFQQTQKESFATVFDDWYRISRLDGANANNADGDSYSDKAMPSELTAWAYDDTTDQVVCQINSVSMVGFISDQRYNNYVLEVQLSSTDGDDDHIGVCVAHAVDNEGNAHTLTVMRSLTGRAPMTVDKNYPANDVNYEVARVYSGLQWGDGSIASEPIANGSLPGWGTLPNGHRLRIVREDDLITIETTLNDGTYHDPAKTLIDLSADPELEVFRGHQHYGYVCHSQLNSTWDVLERSGDRYPILDTRDNTIYTYVDGAWVNQGTDLQYLIDDGTVTPNGLHHNPVTGRYYYVAADKALHPIVSEGA